MFKEVTQVIRDTILETNPWGYHWIGSFHPHHIIYPTKTGPWVSLTLRSNGDIIMYSRFSTKTINVADPGFVKEIQDLCIKK